MIKKMFIIAAIYLLIVLALTLNMSKIGNLYIGLLLSSSLLFGGLLVWMVYKTYLAGFNTENKNVIYTGVQTANAETPRKISTRPFLLGLEKKIIPEEEFYFDNENFYAINKAGQKATFKLTDITEISKTGIQINNRRLWQVKIRQADDSEVIFKFVHNYTLWNRNFLSFYEKVKRISPNAIKSTWSVWTM